MRRLPRLCAVRYDETVPDLRKSLPYLLWVVAAACILWFVALKPAMHPPRRSGVAYACKPALKYIDTAHRLARMRS